MSTNLGCWFEIPTNDVTKATEFYEKSFHINLTPNEMGTVKLAFFPMETTQRGIGGALVSDPNYTPSHLGSMIYLAVDDIEGTLKRITSQGGKILLPKTSIGKAGFVAHFEDIDGNRVGVFSEK